MIAGAVAVLPLLGAPGAAAQEIPGYLHRQWTVRDGAPPNIRTMAQTRDGYLWLGSSNGLFRFDGIRFEQVAPVKFDQFRSNQVTALAAHPNGELWVGYDYGGLAVYRGGRLLPANPGKPRGIVNQIFIEPDGSVWVSILSGKGPQLRLYRDGRWRVREAGADLPPEPMQAVARDRDGALMLAMFPHLYRLDREGGPFSRTTIDVNLWPTFAKDDAGDLWLYSHSGLARVSQPERAAGIQFGTTRGGVNGRWGMLFHEGHFWIAGEEEDLIRLPRDPLRKEAALRYPSAIMALLKDREGSIWGAGADGLHRYVASPFVPDAVPGVPATGIVESRGSLFLATEKGVFELRDGAVRQLSRDRHAIDICSGGEGTVFVVSAGTERVLRNGRQTEIPGPVIETGDAGGNCAVARDGTVWEMVPGHGMFRLDGRTWVLEPDLPPFDHMIWTGPRRFLGSLAMNQLSWVDGSRVTPIWQREDIKVGFVRLMIEIGGKYYVGGDTGLARIDGQSISVLDAGRYPWLSGITGLAVRGDETWIIAGPGIVRARTADIDAAFAAPGRAVAVEHYGVGEGLLARSFAYQANDAAFDTDGNLWLATSQGVVRLDPTRLRSNRVEPPVHITRISSEERTLPMQGASLPPGTNRIAFDYTALSLVDAERNSFRYRLEGIDRDWVDAGGRRRADYVGLGPGVYRFHVIAANSDGVWNRQGYSVSFEIEPYFWQRLWFRLLMVGVAGVSLVLFVRWRLHVATEVARARLEDRMAERERIARDLHDTLLQAIQGLVLRFQSVFHLLPENSPARAAVAEALDRSDDVLMDGRERVQRLREDAAPKDLVAVLRAASGRVDGLPENILTVDGTPLQVCAPVADEVSLIVTEALRNAVQHAKAKTVRLHLRYHRDRIEIEIADDGVGVPRAILSAGKREGHFGLVGMHERAGSVGATLSIENGDAGGTTVRLILPARIAYR